MGLGLQNEEKLLVLLQFSARVLVEGLEIEGVLGGDVSAAEKSSNIASVVLLMLDNFVQGNLVLHKQSNLDVELVDVLLGKFVLSYVLDNSLSQTLEF